MPATHAAAPAAVLGGTQHRCRSGLLCPLCPLPVEHSSDFLALSFSSAVLGPLFPFFLLAWTRTCSLAFNPCSAAMVVVLRSGTGSDTMDKLRPRVLGSVGTGT